MTDVISINIWDDYYDDGFVPEGETQETYAYVDNCDLSDDDQREVLQQFQAQVMELQQPGSSLKCNISWYDSAQVYPALVGTEHEWCLYKRWQLELKNIPHSERESIVEAISGLDLRYGDRPMRIYSES